MKNARGLVSRAVRLGAKALKNLGLQISSAHISTYGERVVDVFYVKDVFGLKITQRTKIQRVQKQLYDALEG